MKLPVTPHRLGLPIPVLACFCQVFLLSTEIKLDLGERIDQSH